MFKLCCLIAVGSSALTTTTRAQNMRIATVAVDSQDNQQPKTPFVMPGQSIEVREALDDFNRYVKREAWEKAFEALEKVQQSPGRGLTPAADGLMLPTEVLVRQALTSLPPSGREAYRLFHDADAKTLMDQATGSNDFDRLNEIYSKHFISSVGASAADRLGDLFFEQGDPVRAADCWRSVLNHHPETQIPRVRLITKQAIALIRAGRRQEVAELLRQLEQRHAGEKVTLGGKEVVASEHVAALLAETKDTAAGTIDLAGSQGTQSDNRLQLHEVALTKEIQPIWQFRFFTSAQVKELASAGRNWGWGRLTVSDFPPPAVVLEDRIFLNLLGYHFAIDKKTGKLMWRSLRFGDLPGKLQQNPSVIAEQYSLTQAGTRLLSVNRDVNMLGQWNQPFRLECLDAATGNQVWMSTAIAEISGYNIMGTPAVDGGKIFICGVKTDQPTELHLLALNEADGKFLWARHLGTHQADQSQMYYRRTAQPSVVATHGKVLVDTHAGGFACVDAIAGTLEWGLSYPSEFVNTEYWYGTPSKPSFILPPLVVNDVVYVKGMRSQRLLAVNLTDTTVVWKRPVSQSSAIAGIDAERIYMMGDELSAIDINTRKMLWATRLPSSSEWISPVLTENRIFQFTSRGIFEVDKATGDVVQSYRGSDLESMGGRMIVSGDYLYTISNAAITAYPRTTAVAAAVKEAMSSQAAVSTGGANSAGAAATSSEQGGPVTTTSDASPQADAADNANADNSKSIPEKK